MMLRVTCPECGGDGVETCNNPDHGFISAVGGEIGRLGCPGCIRGNPKHYGHSCGECNGAGTIEIESAREYIGIDFEDFIWCGQFDDAIVERNIDTFAEWSVSR